MKLEAKTRLLTASKLLQNKAEWKEEVLKQYPEAKFAVVKDSSKDFRAFLDVGSSKLRPAVRFGFQLDWKVEVGNYNGYLNLGGIKQKAEVEKEVKVKTKKVDELAKRAAK